MLLALLYLLPYTAAAAGYDPLTTALLDYMIASALVYLSVSSYLHRSQALDTTVWPAAFCPATSRLWLTSAPGSMSKGLSQWSWHVVARPHTCTMYSPTEHGHACSYRCHPTVCTHSWFADNQNKKQHCNYNSARIWWSHFSRVQVRHFLSLEAQRTIYKLCNERNTCIISHTALH